MSDPTHEHQLERIRNSFQTFIVQSFSTVNPGTPFLENWHIQCVAEHLEAVRRGELKRLIINLPPRALKSVCVTVAWPAFLLGHDPAERIIAASYASSLSVRHSLDTRLLLNAPWYRSAFPDTEIAPGENLKQKFTTTKRGFRFATSVGGSVTGEGGNILIVDDPHNPVQATGAATRQIANRWFDNSFATRLNDKRKGAIVVVMQRLHPEDLTGHLLGKGGWERLSLPAIAPRRMVIEYGPYVTVREEGDLLHPAREDAELIAQAKRELGSAVFNAQYQQEPLAQEGGIVKLHWFRRHEGGVRAERIVQSWDTGIKAGERNDPSACATFAVTREGYALLDMAVMREEYPELKRAAQALAGRWQPHAVLIEDKASGQPLLQDLRRETKLPLIGVRPAGDKVTRLAAVSALVEAGRVTLPREAAWLAAFEAELSAFPNTPHDDQVDAFTQFLQWIRGQGTAGAGMRRV
jgi:predicted phage terminase large subunit-like protein